MAIAGEHALIVETVFAAELVHAASRAASLDEASDGLGDFEDVDRLHGLPAGPRQGDHWKTGEGREQGGAFAMRRFTSTGS